MTLNVQSELLGVGREMSIYPLFSEVIHEPQGHSILVILLLIRILMMLAVIRVICFPFMSSAEITGGL